SVAVEPYAVPRAMAGERVKGLRSGKRARPAIGMVGGSPTNDRRGDAGCKPTWKESPFAIGHALASSERLSCVYLPILQRRGRCVSRYYSRRSRAVNRGFIARQRVPRRSKRSGQSIAACAAGKLVDVREQLSCRGK